MVIAEAIPVCINGCIIIAWYIALLLRAVPSLWAALRQLYCRGLVLDDAAARLRRWYCAGVLMESHEDPDVNEQIASKLHGKQVRLARALVPVFCALASGRVLSIAYTAFLREPPESGVAQDSAFVALFSGFTICTLCPRLLVSRSLPAWHVYFMLTGGIYSSPLVIGFDIHFVLMQSLTMIGTTSVGFVCLRFPVVCLTNIVQSVIMVVAFAAKLDPDMGLSCIELVQGEVLCLLLKLAVFRCATLMMEWSTHQEVVGQAKTCERSAISSLLEVLCDVVVDLDQNLTIKEHPAKFGVMLMQESGKSLQGCAFRDFLAGKEDRDTFQRAVNSGGDDEVVLSPSLFGVSVRDAIDNTIRVAVHHVPYRSLTGRTHHLVGLSEDSSSLGAVIDGAGAQAQGSGVEGRLFSGRATMPPAVLTDAVIHELRAGPGPGAQASPVARSCGVIEGWASSGGGESMEEFMVEVWATDGLEISRASDAFEQAFGPGGCERRCFREWLSHVDGERLAQWIVEVSQEVICGDRPPHISSFGVVGFLHRGVSEPWTLEVCFPRLHPELYRKQSYLVGIRLKDSSTCPNPGAPHSPSATPGGALGRAALRASL
eukprot:CAMPEP_0176040030 /NCGR_PEP_ID=MMETSP0120_2-20121206/19846_1 /TAXON_ID=160619 /ORGANISM="Kryptoperidinium foliaceum, Strain CCMP 1326" /LENGTH=599 /DNA_ID=CAMNT_0017373425 /DNA_START=108 /DNA_END=1907 /DNA_ORIENTATION=+